MPCARFYIFVFGGERGSWGVGDEVLRLPRPSVRESLGTETGTLQGPPVTAMRPRYILLGGLAYLLVVHPSASTRRPMSMMPRFSEREREGGREGEREREKEKRERQRERERRLEETRE